MSTKMGIQKRIKFTGKNRKIVNKTLNLFNYCRQNYKKTYQEYQKKSTNSK